MMTVNDQREYDLRDRLIGFVVRVLNIVEGLTPAHFSCFIIQVRARYALFTLR
jgi:hypothetical protein